MQITPVPGLDPSWILGLNLAAAAGLDHGTEVAFTYGPLGFLEQPMVVDGLLSTLAAIYLLGLRALLAASLLWAARRSFSWPAAAAIALVVAAIVPRTVGSVCLALTLLWCLVALQSDSPPWTARLLVYGGGVLAAIESMIKLNIGATVALAVAIAVLGLPGARLRNLARAGATFLLTFAICWFVAGQGVGNLDDYVRTSLQLIAGYAHSMQIEQGAVSWDWAAALLMVGSVFVAVLVAAAREPLRARLAMAAIVAIFAFSLEKYGFVRHDAGHAAVLFGVLAVVWLALRWRNDARVVALAAVAATALVYFPVADEQLDSTFAPRQAVEQLADLVVPSERDEVADRARSEMALVYGVEPEIVDRIGSESVDARPWEIGLIWAYGLDWRPLPVLQDYAAYTPDLDRLDADALTASDGPHYVLRHLGYGSTTLFGLDGRLTTFDSPLVQRALLCNFRVVRTTATAQLLERGSDRCGPERTLETVSADYGEVVRVPRGGPGEAVFARIDGASAEGIERLRSALYRDAVRTVHLGSTQARFQGETAPDGILLEAPAGADFPRPFALALNAPTIVIDSEGGFATSDGPLRIEFFSVSVGSVPRR